MRSKPKLLKHLIRHAARATNLARREISTHWGRLSVMPALQGNTAKLLRGTKIDLVGATATLAWCLVARVRAVRIFFVAGDRWSPLQVICCFYNSTEISTTSWTSHEVSLHLNEPLPLGEVSAQPTERVIVCAERNITAFRQLHCPLGNITAFRRHQFSSSRRRTAMKASGEICTEPSWRIFFFPSFCFSSSFFFLVMSPP